VHGLTTAASLWATASIGTAVAYGRYITSALVAIVFFVLLVIPTKQWERERGRPINGTDGPTPLLRFLASHQRVYVLNEFLVVSELGCYSVPFSLEHRTGNCTPDFTLRKQPQISRNVPVLVKVV